MGFESVSESGAGDVGEEAFESFVFVGGGGFGDGDFEEAEAEDIGEVEGVFVGCHPDVFVEVEGVDAFGEDVADEDGDVGVHAAFVFTEFGWPGVAPCFGAFDFPDDDACGLAVFVSDFLGDVCSVDSFGDGGDFVGGEGFFEAGFEVEF